MKAAAHLARLLHERQTSRLPSPAIATPSASAHSAKAACRMTRVASSRKAQVIGLAAAPSRGSLPTLAPCMQSVIQSGPASRQAKRRRSWPPMLSSRGCNRRQTVAEASVVAAGTLPLARPQAFQVTTYRSEWTGLPLLFPTAAQATARRVEKRSHYGPTIPIEIRLPPWS